MSLNLNAHLGELAMTLGDLQRQFRQAARVEVARAVGDALRQFAVATICGPAARPRRTVSEWDDPWEQPSQSWTEDRVESNASVSSDSASKMARFHAAVLLGIGGARWTFLRTRHPALAAAAGLLLVLLVLAGGRSTEALLDAWTSANVLLRNDALVVWS
jgi:hypothetical protein